MGYGNRPTMPNNNYQKGSFNKNYNQQQFNKSNGFSSGSKNVNKSFDNSVKKNNNFSAKDKDDIYTPKTYAKKTKEKSFFDDIVIPEYLEDRQRMRNKRENDKKYKNKRNH
jgi:hypothetical protein